MDILKAALPNDVKLKLRIKWLGVTINNKFSYTDEDLASIKSVHILYNSRTECDHECNCSKYKKL